MNRHLRHEEENFIKSAIQFFMENGPELIQVADYSSSYPNNPEKAKVIWDVQESGNKLIETLNEHAGDYREMLENFILYHVDDLWDHLNMVSELTFAAHEMQQKVMHIQKEIEEQSK